MSLLAGTSTRTARSLSEVAQGIFPSCHQLRVSKFSSLTTQNEAPAFAIEVWETLDCLVQSYDQFHPLGLSQILERRGEMAISSFSLPQSRRFSVTAPAAPRRPTLYHKNGILVGHSGHRITPEDVANALNEE